MRITRLFIDNYKCFVGFDFRPQAIQPIFGLNGTGKSTLFEVLAGLKRLVADGEQVDSCFPESIWPRWKLPLRLPLHVVLEIGDEDLPTQFRYEIKLVVDHKTTRTKIHSEALTAHFHDSPLYAFQGYSATLYHDIEKTTDRMLADEARSGLPSVNLRSGTRLLHTFRDWLANVHWVALNPGLMRGSVSQGEEPSLDWGGTNFVSWLRYLTQTRLPVMGGLLADLRECVPGLNAIRFEQVGRQWPLWADFDCPTGGKPDPYQFSEVSDGQRMLIALYAVYHGLKGSNAVLCMDEPANYLALAEIQPYLLRLRDAVGDGLAQLFVVTHNPEAINDLAPDHPALFTRADDGSIHVQPFPETNPDGLSAAELIARGWEQP